jgi:hypothetical protein
MIHENKIQDCRSFFGGRLEFYIRLLQLGASQNTGSQKIYKSETCPLLAGNVGFHSLGLRFVSNKTIEKWEWDQHLNWTVTETMGFVLDTGI